MRDEKVSLSWRGWRWAALLAASLSVAACGGGAGTSGTPTLTWYINPDNGGQARLAEECSKQSGGAYEISTQILPTAADQQREQLVRRLAAEDSSIDLMSLDPPFTAEFANAGYLLELEKYRGEFTQGVLDAPIAAAEWKGRLVAAPFWANTQLLWYKKSVAEEAGVDPTADDFTWDEMIKAAEQTDTIVGVQANQYEGYMVWINALVDSAGGQILENQQAGQDAQPAISSPAGDAAAQVIGTLGRSSAADAGISTSDEEVSRAAFQGESGGFMVNWPYVYSAALGEVDAGSLEKSVFDDIAWARYPGVDPGTESKPPLGGINLAISDFSEYKKQALDAARCITSTENKTAYMLDSGNPSAAAASYDDPEVRKAYPMADLIRDSINDAGPRPITPYYTDVSTSVQRSWHPPSSVQAPGTPEESAQLITEVLNGEVLL